MVIEFQLNYLKDGATVISSPLYDKLKTLLWGEKKKNETCRGIILYPGKIFLLMLV